MLETLTRELAPLVEAFDGVDLSDGKAAAAAIEARIPYASATVTRIRDLANEGYEAGWLTPNENGPLRFGRVAKDLDGYSVDAVCMDSTGPKHRHPKGEISLCFVRDGEPRFDGHAAGWVVLPTDSTHVPTVRGGTMLILYFLPGGEVEWLRD
ncbi:MAG: DUF4863 family protein [Planctomycetes bacterium]|nr:DUF4863 family protein [Planctomycetota bacterium]